MTDSQTVQGADDALLAKLETPPPEAWIPETAGETITGAFLRLEKGSTAFGASMFVVIGQEGGVERSVWLFYESLKTAFRRARPEPGEMIAIRYNGELPVKNPTKGHKDTYHDYQVVVDRPMAAGAVDWDTAIPEPTPDPSEAA